MIQHYDLQFSLRRSNDLTRTDVFDGELGRLDYNVSDSHKFFFSFRHNYRVENRSNLYKNIATGNFLNRINVLIAEHRIFRLMLLANS